MSNFPHLNDTSFPAMGNVDPYKYQNDFDYEAWDSNTEILLTGVSWDRNYKNVVVFTNADKRNEYFSSLTKINVNLTSKQFLEDDRIKVPVPITSCKKFNYLIVKFPDLPLDNYDENSPYNVNTLYYFVTGYKQVAPSVTELQLEEDVWQTYGGGCGLNSKTRINWIKLARGHKPMASAWHPGDKVLTIDQYIEKLNNISGEDVNFDDGNHITKIREMISVSGVDGTDPYVMFQSYCDMSQVKELSGDMSGVTDIMPVGGPTTSATVGDQLRTYAFKYSQMQSFINNVVQYIPYFLETIEFFAIVDGTGLAVDPSSEYDFHGVKMYYVSSHFLSSVHISHDDIYSILLPEKYKKISKLYKYPYSYVRANTMDGDEKVFDLSKFFDDVSFLGAMNISSDGVSGTCIANEYDPQCMSGAVSKVPWSGCFNVKRPDIKNYDPSLKMDFTIPVFQVAISKAREADWKTNIPNSKARLQIETGYGNTNLGLDTSHSNSINSASTSYAIASRSATASLDNENDKLFMDRHANYSEKNKIQYDSEQQKYTAGANYALSSSLNAVQAALTSVAETQQMIFSKEEAYAGAISSTITSVAAGATLGGSVPGAAAGLASGAISSAGTILASSNNEAMTGTSQSLRDIYNWSVYGNKKLGIPEKSLGDCYESTSEVLSHYTLNPPTSTSIKGVENFRTYLTRKTIDEDKSFNSLNSDSLFNNANSLVNGGNAKWVDTVYDGNEPWGGDSVEVRRWTARQNTSTQSIKGIGVRNKETALANANDSKNLSILVADNVYNTGKSINEIDANCKYELLSYDTKIAGFGAPVVYGAKGKEINAITPDGVVVSVCRQSDSSIAQAGDEMLRYGYYYHRSLDGVSYNSLQVMNRYSYWQADDITIRSRAESSKYGMISSNIIEKLEDIFKNGTTVWTEPDFIGQYDLYNWKY